MSSNEDSTAVGAAGSDGAGRAQYPLWGRGLRMVLTDALRRRPRTTVAELVMVLDGHGYSLGGRASKVISDALRWEVNAGRVERLSRGVYRFRQATESRMRRILLFARFCRLWVVAVTRGERPPPTPKSRPNAHRYANPHPDEPPWHRIGWVWGL